MTSLLSFSEDELEAFAEFLSEFAAWVHPEAHLDPEDVMELVHEHLYYHPIDLDAARVLGVMVRSLKVSAASIRWH